MKKKNSLPLKWVLLILLSLTAIVFCTNHISKNIAVSSKSEFHSKNSLLEFLENILGIFNLHFYWGQGYAGNGSPGQNNHSSWGWGVFHWGNQQNPNSMNSPNAFQLNGHNSARNQNAAENNQDNNSYANSKNTSDQSSESNSEINAQVNSDLNPNNNPNNPSGDGQNNGNNSNSSTESGANNPQGNAPMNADNNSGGNPGAPSGSYAGDNGGSGNNPGELSGGNSGAAGSGDNAGANNSSGDATGGSNQPNLQTINPIPTDAQVAASIAAQNQQALALNAILASRQALVAPVQEQAQASKYQTVAAENIPAPSTNTAPADVIQKVQAHQLALH